MVNVDFWYMPNSYNLTNTQVVVASWLAGTGCQLDTSVNATGFLSSLFSLCLSLSLLHYSDHEPEGGKVLVACITEDVSLIIGVGVGVGESGGGRKVSMRTTRPGGRDDQRN